MNLIRNMRISNIKQQDIGNGLMKLEVSGNSMGKTRIPVWDNSVIKEAKFRAALMLKNDLESGATHLEEHYGKEDAPKIEKEIYKMIHRLIKESTQS